MTAAAWVHAHRACSLRRMREAYRGEDAGKPRRVREECPACGITTGLECEICGGRGATFREVAGENERPAPLDEEVARCVGEFLSAFTAIKRLGVDGWLALSEPDADGTPARPDPDLMDRILAFDMEMDRLEFEGDLLEAQERASEK